MQSSCVSIPNKDRILLRWRFMGKFLIVSNKNLCLTASINGNYLVRSCHFFYWYYHNRNYYYIQAKVVFVLYWLNMFMSLCAHLFRITLRLVANKIFSFLMSMLPIPIDSCTRFKKCYNVNSIHSPVFHFCFFRFLILHLS